MSEKKKPISNLSELWTRLATLFDDLETGTVESKVAAELNNTAGKMIGAAKIQLEYYALRKESPDIKFLESEQPS